MSNVVLSEMKFNDLLQYMHFPNQRASHGDKQKILDEMKRRGDYSMFLINYIFIYIKIIIN